MNNSKKIISLLLSLFMALSVFTIVPFSVSAEGVDAAPTGATADEAYPDFMYEAFNDGTAEITGYIGSGGDVTIPSTIGGYTVTSIGDYAFIGCTGLTSVVIGNSVTSIGDYAFWDCTGLTSVVIPDSVTSIGWNAFSGCTGLTSMKVSEGNSVYDSRNNCNAIIDTELNNLIFGCKNTVIPDSVTWIGDGAFSGCTGLTSVVIPDSVKSIGGGAFSGCTGLTSVVIPDSVTSINYWAFSGCTGLTSMKVSEGNSVYDSRNNCNAIIETESNKLISGCKNTVIPDSVTSIGYAAFYGCTGLTSVVIPDSVTSIGWYAFYGCTGLTSVVIPDSVTSIDDWAFRDCTDLTSVVIPDSVTSIGGGAFLDCTGLTSMVIPDSVTSIGYEAFGYILDSNWDKHKIDGFIIYGHKGTAAETYANENGFRFIVLGEENGAKVKGAVTSFIDESEVTVKLTGTDNDFTATVTGTTDYAIEDVPEGKYTLTVSKKDHVTREYTVTVAEDDVTQDVKINPVGDVNGDGSVSIADYSRINKHVCKVKAISGYEYKCADVNGDGNVSIADLSRVNKHVCKVKKLW